MKTCPNCTRELDFHEFDTRRDGKAQSWCRACMGSRNRNRRTITVPSDDHARLKELAAAKGVPLSAFLSIVIERGLAAICNSPGCLGGVGRPGGRCWECQHLAVEA